jgi:5'-3' exonuclease
MGIKGMSQFLKKYNVRETVDIAYLRYKKVAIDTPMYFYKFKSVCDPQSLDWLCHFANLTSFLRRHDIHPVFVFEGKAPVEKAGVQEERRQQRQKYVSKTDNIERDLEKYLEDGTLTDLLHQVATSKRAKNSLLPRKRLLVRSSTSGRIASLSTAEGEGEERCTGVVDSSLVYLVQEEIKHRRKYDVTITSECVKKLKELLELLGVCYIQSDGEAERDCVSLFYKGLVDYIITEDTDVLAYNATLSGAKTVTDRRRIEDPAREECEIKRDLVVILDLCTDDLTFVQISKQNVLNVLGLSADTFTDFCIMCGTDYNKNIFRVGIETSFKLLTKHHFIENVPLDTAILNHHRVRQLFTIQTDSETKFQNKDVKWCRLPSSHFVDNMAVFKFTYGIRNINVTQVLQDLGGLGINI